MSPGPVSDSYDPEFSTGANRHEVAEAVRAIVAHIGLGLGERQHIVDVIHGPRGRAGVRWLSEAARRVIRFALERALESL